MVWPFRLTSYNILADAYATTRLYPSIAPNVLSWERRRPAIVARVVALQPDFACLQEVQATHWPEFESAFLQCGWSGEFAQKRQGRPDGCALLYRSASIQCRAIEALYFVDGDQGAPDSGHLALIGTFDTPGGLLGVATTHLRWQAPTMKPQDHIGYRQAAQMMQHLASTAPPGFPTVVCGDFNAPQGTPVLELIERQGLIDAYSAAPQSTCNPHGRTARIDYIFATPGLNPVPEQIPSLAGGTPLPSIDEPSDHLPITAALLAGGGLLMS